MIGLLATWWFIFATCDPLRLWVFKTVRHFLHWLLEELETHIRAEEAQK